MKVLLQRVKKASVDVDGETIGSIEQGLLVFLGIEKNDSIETLHTAANKVLAYRVFADPHDKMNLSVRDIKGGILVVSQFTLVANTQKGLRPSFSSAAPPETARKRYQEFVRYLEGEYSPIATGEFGADMEVTLINDGPVTFLLES